MQTTPVNPNTQQSVSALVQRLAALDTPAVSDAMDQMQLVGVLSSLRALSVIKRIAGVAITVQLGRANGASPSRHLCSAAVDASGPGCIIVIAHNGCTEVAGWGGILSLGAVARRAEGVIIDGACRDVDESRELGLPVYGRASVPVTARGRIVEKTWNEVVTIDGIPVAPGDLVIADGSGIVFVPQDRASDVIEAAERISAREREMAVAARQGKSMAEVMGANYERMLDQEPMP